MGKDRSESTERIVLPEKYYLDYFLDLIDFVREHSGHLIGPDEEIFLEKFFHLSENAQCLFIRFSNRKGPYFRADKLDYQEIDIPPALEELNHAGFITYVESAEEDILRHFTKQELLHVYADLGLAKNIKKADLFEQLIEHADFSPLTNSFPLVLIEFQDAVEYLKMLFFGHYKAQMTEFVIRDVGHVQLEDLSGHQFKPWFSSLEEAKAMFDISQIYSQTRKALHLYPASYLHDILSEIDFGRFTSFAYSRKISNKLSMRLGQELEREKELELALYYYEKTDEHPGRERQIRILERLGMSEKALQVANKIMGDSRNASELLFAKDYLERPKIKILRSTTKKIKASNASIAVPKRKGINVEQLALEHFEKDGYKGLHGENYIWNNLFGLTFWEELLDSKFESYHHPLQRTTSDIHKTDFFEKREGQLNSRLNKLKTRKSWQKQIQRLIDEKQGISNRFVYWHPDIQLHMEKLLQYLPLKGVKSVLLEMAVNLKDNSKGFPDLFIWKNKDYQFFEVKSPNDHLSAQQLYWIEFFQKHKINTEVLKVSYIDSSESS